MARLTLNGMYEYEPTLFDGMILPEDFDRDALLFEILQRSGQLYPYHQQPPVLKSAIRLWFARNYLNFDRTMEALMAEYNPIENYDRYEDWTRTPDLTDEDKRTGSDTLDHTGDDTLDRSGDDTLSHTGDDTLDRSGDDTLSHTGDDTLDRSGDDTLSHTGDDTLKHSDKDTLTHDYTDASPYTEKMIRGAGPHTTEEQVSAYDNASYQPSKKTIEDWGAQPADRTDEKQIGGKYKEETSFGKQEKTTYNSDQKTTYDSQEKTTYNSDQKTTYDSQEKTTYNSDQKTTYDSQEKTTYDSQEKTTYGSTVTGRHTGTETYTAHMHGNIGVTSSQQMQQMSIDLYKYDIYVDIASRFEHEFLVQVY